MTEKTKAETTSAAPTPIAAHCPISRILTGVTSSDFSFSTRLGSCIFCDVYHIQSQLNAKLSFLSSYRLNVSSEIDPNKREVRNIWDVGEEWNFIG